MNAGAHHTMPEPEADARNVAVPNLIAVVGCDGTGKSTLTRDLVAHFARERPATRRYLGLVSGEMGEKIRHLPLVGRRLEPHLARKAARAQDMHRRLPGIWTAFVMYVLSRWRALHFRRTVRLARDGVLVVTDRYPQAEIAGFRYDGPGLGAARARNALLRWLARREQRIYERMASQRPSLVIRLDIDPATAEARKPDHSPAELRDKIAVMARLRFRGARIVELDTRAPYAEVRRRAITMVAAAAGRETSHAHA